MTGLVLHAKFPSYLRWSQPFIHALICGLAEHTRQVVLCNQREEPELFPMDTLETVANAELIEPSRATLTAARLARKYAPSLLHAHFGWSGIRVLLLKRLLGVPLVTTFGGRDLAAHWHDPTLRPLYDLLIASSEAMVCVSHELRARLIAAGVEPERVQVVHRGADLGSLRQTSRQGRDGPLRLLMAGRLVEKKGHRYALEALAMLKRDKLAAVLAIVGSGPQRARLEILANRLGLADCVTFTPQIPQTRLRDLMHRADVLLQPSVTATDGDSEGIPNVLVEAAATGLPVVATRHGGIVEAVVEGVTGSLVPERDPEALADALRQLLECPDRRHQMGEAAARHAREHFDIQAQIRRYLQLYASLPEASCCPELPPDIVRLTRTAVRHESSAGEWLVDSLREIGDPNSPLDGGPVDLRGLWGRLYATKERLPKRWRHALRPLLRGTLKPLVLARRYLRHGHLDALTDRCNDLALDLLTTGGDLGDVDPAWTLEELHRFLKRRAQLRAGLRGGRIARSSTPTKASP